MGEELDVTGLVLKATLEDNSVIDVPENICEISGFDSMAAGVQTITAKLLTNNEYPDGKKFTATFTVTVTPDTPVIRLQPVGAVYSLAETAKPLTTVAEISDAGTLTWQWYFSENATGEGASAIEGATAAQYTPENGKSGYYFAEATNSGSSGDGVTTRTNIVSVVFGDFEARIGSSYYSTLAEAVSAAADGDTVELLKDVTLTETATSTKTITITGNCVNRGASFGGVMFKVTAGKLTLQDIIVDGGAGSEQSQVCTVTVTPFVPASVAIAKFKALG